MKNIRLYLMLGLFAQSLLWCGNLAAQARMGAQEQAKLAKRIESFQAEQVRQKAELQRQASELGIPFQKTEGDRVLTLRSIANGQGLYDANDNVISQRTVSANRVKANGGMGLGLTGAGQTLGIWEAFEIGTGAAVRTTHQEFGGRATSVDGGTFSSHATHVACTMIGSGVDPSAEGFSSGADLRCFDLIGDVDEMGPAADAATPIRVSNHSYGTIAGWSFNRVTNMWDWKGNSGETLDWKFGAYNNDAKKWDEVAYDHPFLTICKAAGNDRGDGPGTPGTQFDGGPNGFDCIPTYGTAKNIITVGAIDAIPGGYAGPASVFQFNTAFSGWGPTDDGRIKPDVVADGDALFSANQLGDNTYSEKSGTSMASPSVAGSVGLLLEHWQNIIGGVPRSATMKGLLIEEADEAGTALGPDYSFGWGLINVADATQLITIEGYDGCQQFVEGAVGDGDVYNLDLFSSGQYPIKVTLTWNDVPGTSPNNGTLNPPGVSYLTNDLNLRLDHGATTFMPWVLNPANPGHFATTGNNTRDNTEQILLLTPGAGKYTIRVVAPATVNDGPQHFTLWFSGNDAMEANRTVSGVIYNNTQTVTARTSLAFGPAVTLNAPANVRAYAGESISFKPGFRATAGSVLRAQIKPGGACGEFSGVLKTDNYTFAGTAINRNETTDTPPATEQPDAVQLSAQLSPNPATDVVSLRFELKQAEQGKLYLLNQQGQLLRILQSGRLYEKGSHIEQFDVCNLPAGAYYCVFEHESGKTTLPLVK